MTGSFDEVLDALRTRREVLMGAVANVDTAIAALTSGVAVRKPRASKGRKLSAEHVAKLVAGRAAAKRRREAAAGSGGGSASPAPAEV